RSVDENGKRIIVKRKTFNRVAEAQGKVMHSTGRQNYIRAHRGLGADRKGHGSETDRAAKVAIAKGGVRQMRAGEIHIREIRGSEDRAREVDAGKAPACQVIVREIDAGKAVEGAVAARGIELVSGETFGGGGREVGASD